MGEDNAHYDNITDNGTGHLILSNDTSNSISTKRFDDIIAQHQFKPNLIKIDTDGFDFKVIRSAPETLKTYKSALYFEWDKAYLEQNNEDSTSIFHFLAQLGYDECLIFDNFGTPLCQAHCQEDGLSFSLLADYPQKSQNNIYYYDVLVFHKNSNLSISELVKYL